MENFEILAFIENATTLTNLTDKLNALYDINQPERYITLPIDARFLDEVQKLNELPDVLVQVSKKGQVRVLVRDSRDREHSTLILTKGQQYSISETSLPFSTSQEYSGLMAAVEAYRQTVESLQDYLDELQLIDTSCWVIDPRRPTWKDGYRKIVIEEGVCVEVQVEAGSGAGAGGVRVCGVGPAAQRLRATLSARLSLWDNALSVLHNIANVLELDELCRAPTCGASEACEEPCCGICLCGETAWGAPLPLCVAKGCGSYFHRECLKQWLVSAAGGAVPRVGVVSGRCPACLASVSLHT